MNTRTVALLEPRLVRDVEGTFFVRDYQRGYRWGAEEVRRLLDDINDAGGRNYYLQPVVLKRLEDGRWELVDGQQRLTTLYLVLFILETLWPPSVTLPQAPPRSRIDASRPQDRTARSFP